MSIIRGQHLAAIFIVSLLGAGGVLADDWPQWRGPQRDGVWRETGILDTIPPDGLKVLWRTRIGNGYSGPSVADGRVFVTDRLPHLEVERVMCFDQATGRSLWEYAYPCPYKKMEYGNGPRASPTVHDGRVYTLGTKGHLLCLDAATGRVLWQKDLVRDYNARAPRYGISAAPLIEGDLLIVCAGGRPDATVIAFDRRTGDERWRALPDRPAYSAPIALTAAGRRQVIVWTADHVNALDPATGAVLWQVRYKTTFDEAQVVASPVPHNDRLLCLAAWHRGSLMLKLDTDKPDASVLWRTRSQPSTVFTTPIFSDDHFFYGIDGYGNLCCWDAATGDEVWSTDEPAGGNVGTAHLTPNADRVFIFNPKGHLILGKLTPEGYEQRGRTLLVEPTAGFRAQGPVAWAHPAYADRCVFARNDRELVCASLAAGSISDVAAPSPMIRSRVLADSGGSERCEALAFSPDGKRLAIGAWLGKVKLLDVATGKEHASEDRHRYWVCSVAFSSDGKLLASAGGNEFYAAGNNYRKLAEAIVWDVATDTKRGRLEGHTDQVRTVAFSPDNKTLATGAADQTVRLWDVGTLTERAVLKGHTEAVWSLAFSPDGKTLASASWDKTVRLWDPHSGALRGNLQGHDEEVLTVAISPDGKTLATGSSDWSVRLWDLPTRTERAVLRGHGGAVYCLAFSPDGSTLATGSGDETVRLWRIADGRARMTLRGHTGGIRALAFSPDGKTLATAAVDDAVRLWDLTALP